VAPLDCSTLAVSALVRSTTASQLRLIRPCFPETVIFECRQLDRSFLTAVLGLIVLCRGYMPDWFEQAGKLNEATHSNVAIRRPQDCATVHDFRLLLF